MLYFFILLVGIGQVFCLPNIFQKTDTLEEKIFKCRRFCANDPVPHCRKEPNPEKCVETFLGFCTKTCIKLEYERQNPEISKINAECIKTCDTSYTIRCQRRNCRKISRKTCRCTEKKKPTCDAICSEKSTICQNGNCKTNEGLCKFICQ